MSSSARLPQLDALRAFAITAVLVEHWAGGLQQRIPIGGGTLGVQLFFTLSGFLITGILLEDLEGRAGTPGRVLAAFYIRRIFRLAPAFYSVLLILGLLGIGGIGSSWPWHVAYLSNFYMAMGGTESVLWTLSVEEQFYVLWPMVLLVTPREKLPTVAVLTILLAPIARVLTLSLGSPLSFYLLPWQLDAIGAGCLIGILSFRNGKRNQFEWFVGRRATIFTIFAVFCISLAVLDWYIHRKGLTRYLFVNPLCAVFFAWLILVCAKRQTGLIGAVLSNPVLQYIGRISYGIYLVHNWAPDIVEKFFGPLPKYQAAPIVVVLTFSVCAVSWRYFESPMIRVGRRLSEGFDKKPESAQPPTTGKMIQQEQVISNSP